MVCVERPETELIKADCNGSADPKPSESKDTETEGCKASFAMSKLFAAGSTGVGGLLHLICGRQKLGHVQHSPHGSPQIPAQGVSMRRGLMLKSSMFTATRTTICTCNTALMKELAVLAGAPVGARIESHA